MGKHSVFIDGGAGTTGLRIRQRLAAAPDIELLELPEEQRKSPAARLALVRQADVTVLCLPDAAAKELVAAAPAGARICDASTAHRTKPGWVYGFAELHGTRKNLQSAARVAVPGCHATGFIALVRPLTESGVLPPNAALGCTSLTGYSGGGKAMIEAYEAPGRPAAYDAPRQYGLGMLHKHLPEMQAVCGLHSAPLFCPVVANYYSGMLVSLPLPPGLLPGGLTRQKLAELLQAYYAGEKLVRVHGPKDGPEDGFLAANALAGRDDLEIFVLGSDETPLLAARFDNLGKGASGAAVQCLNIMLGRPEADLLVLE